VKALLLVAKVSAEQKTIETADINSTITLP